MTEPKLGEVWNWGGIRLRIITEARALELGAPKDHKAVFCGEILNRDFDGYTRSRESVRFSCYPTGSYSFTKLEDAPVTSHGFVGRYKVESKGLGSYVLTNPTLTKIVTGYHIRRGGQEYWNATDATWGSKIRASRYSNEPKVITKTLARNTQSRVWYQTFEDGRTVESFDGSLRRIVWSGTSDMLFWEGGENWTTNEDDALTFPQFEREMRLAEVFKANRNFHQIRKC